MLPVLFEVGPLAVHSWGIAVALAFGAAWLVLRAELGRLAQRRDAAASIVVAAAIGGLVGAKLYWVAEHVGDASGGFLTGAGFTWYGGAVGGTVAALLVAKRLGVPFAALLGAAAPALALGYALGRVACQLAGDGTYGVPSDLPWAMSYPDGEVPTTERVHPTPVYETLAGLLTFGLLWRARRALAPLDLFALYLILAGAARFLVEFVRLNDAVAVGLTQPQLWSLAMAVLGAALLVARRTGWHPRSVPAT
jgi:phosphatidylglycerol:prolipoprotein diacylglycerol transferase